MEAQWREAVARGHDVQLHLHPNWLPELGATQVAGRWTWDWSRGRISDYPGDVASLLARCRDRLETVIRPVEPSFRVSCFRAGAYEAQPFERLHAGLLAAEIKCDTSVYAGGRRADRSYDYSLAHSDHRPYFASRTDPQLAAPPGGGQGCRAPGLRLPAGPDVDLRLRPRVGVRPPADRLRGAPPSTAGPTTARIRSRYCASGATRASRASGGRGDRSTGSFPGRAPVPSFPRRRQAAKSTTASS